MAGSAENIAEIAVSNQPSWKLWAGCAIGERASTMNPIAAATAMAIPVASKAACAVPGFALQDFKRRGEPQMAAPGPIILCNRSLVLNRHLAPPGRQWRRFDSLTGRPII